MNGIELIAAERKRQIEKEGWTAKHDSEEHEEGDLARAGVCYALCACGVGKDWAKALVRSLWPFEDEWWKPKRRLRNLVRAGALIAAEIDLLQGNDAEREFQKQGDFGGTGAKTKHGIDPAKKRAG